KLEHGEFRVVLGGDAFVAEIAVDFVNAVISPDGQSLQVKFRRNPQIQVDVESVVVSQKRARGGPARNRVHHGRLDFDVAPRVEEPAQFLDNPGAGHKDLAGFLVGDEVQIALAVAQFH